MDMSRKEYINKVFRNKVLEETRTHLRIIEENVDNMEANRGSDADSLEEILKHMNAINEYWADTTVSVKNNLEENYR